MSEEAIALLQRQKMDSDQIADDLKLRLDMALDEIKCARALFLELQNAIADNVGLQGTNIHRAWLDYSRKYRVAQ